MQALDDALAVKSGRATCTRRTGVAYHWRRGGMLRRHGAKSSWQGIARYSDGKVVFLTDRAEPKLYNR